MRFPRLSFLFFISLFLWAFETAGAQGVVGPGGANGPGTGAGGQGAAGGGPATAPAVVVAPALPESGKYSIVERSDFRRYEDGVFVGVEYREMRGILDWSPSEGGQRVEGTLYILRELTHAGLGTAKEIEAEVPVSYVIGADGVWDVEKDAGYPALRGFPVLPAGGLAAGKGWRSYGVRIVDPMKDGTYTRVRFYCEYGFDGKAVNARYALRYKAGDDPAGDPRLLSVSGSHTVSIELSPSSERLSFMKDMVDETYALSGGGSVAYKGFTLTWFSTTMPLDGSTEAKIAQDLSRSGASDIQVTRKDEGISISLNNIHFIAEQAVVLPEETQRLQALAAALKKIPERTFRVVGHTARVGTVQSQMDLSVKRAKAIVDFLVSQGIPASRFLYEGKGGTEPVAPNDTEENMAKNRRVEIVILED